MKKVLLSTALAVLLVGCTATTQAPAPKLEGAGVEVVEKIIKENNIEVVDYEYVLSKIGDGRVSNAKAVILDARPFKRHNETGKIPGSLPMPDTEIDKYFDVALKGKPKDVEIITYCQGIACEKSPKLAAELKKRGYTNVKNYSGGMPDWEQKNYIDISLTQAKALYDQNKALFLDARPLNLYKKGTILGALHFPDSKAEELKGRLPIDKNIPIVAFCSGFDCEKSHNLSRFLIKEGYKKVMNFSGGYPEWNKAGYETTASAGAEQKPTVSRPEMVGPIKLSKTSLEPDTVDTEWFKSVVSNLPKDITLIDVRSKEEYASGHIPGAINIPNDTKIEDLEKLLPKSGYVIFYCKTGATSGEVYMNVKEKLKAKDMERYYILDATVKCDKNNKCEIK